MLTFATPRFSPLLDSTKGNSMQLRKFGRKVSILRARWKRNWNWWVVWRDGIYFWIELKSCFQDEAFSTQVNQNKSQIIPRAIDKQPNSGRNWILIGSQFIARYYSPTKTNPYIIFNYSFIMVSKQNEGEKYILPSSIILADLGLKNIIIPFHSNWNLSSNKTLYHQITPFAFHFTAPRFPSRQHLCLHRSLHGTSECLCNHRILYTWKS